MPSVMFWGVLHKIIVPDDHCKHYLAVFNLLISRSSLIQWRWYPKVGFFLEKKTPKMVQFGAHFNPNMVNYHTEDCV